MDSSLFRARNDASASVNCMYRDQSSAAVPALQIGAQHVSAFPQAAPRLAIFFDFPEETNALGRVAQSDLVKIAHLRMTGLNASQPTLHFVTVFQTAGLDSSGQAL